MADPDERIAPDRLSPLRLPGLVAQAFRLVWQAARGELVACIVVQILSGVGLTAQLLLGRNVLAAVVDDQNQRLADVLPDLLGLAVLTALLGFATALVRERQQILSELVERHVQGQIIDVVSAVDLGSFESPVFHDRLQRAKVNAANRSWQAAFGLLTLLSGLAGMAGLGFVLLSVEPLVLPAVLVAGFPLWVATTRNGRAAYDFAYGMTAADRERAYLQEALTGSAEAKEIRLFSLAAFLRRRYDDLYGRRIAELRLVARRRMRRSLAANGVATLVTLLGVGVLVQLALTKRISPADASVAAVAVQQLGARLRGLDASAGNLHECSLFLDDLVTFLELRTSAEAERPTATAPSCFQARARAMRCHWPIDSSAPPGARRAHRRPRRRSRAPAVREHQDPAAGAGRAAHLPPVLERPLGRPDLRPRRRPGGRGGDARRAAATCWPLLQDVRSAGVGLLG